MIKYGNLLRRILTSAAAVVLCTGMAMTDVYAAKTVDRVYVYGDQLGDLPDPTPPDGYRFVGWYTKPDGEGGAKISSTTQMPSKNTVWYAHYEKIGGTPDYHGDGGHNQEGGEAPGETADNRSENTNKYNIHTPVMAPAELLTADMKPSSKARKTTSASGGVSGTPDTKTQLYNDESSDTTSQLRLDSYYFIHWTSIVHRNAPTPKYGGFSSQTDDASTGALEEDQFTRDKFMKFPFEVVYRGHAYKPNQWIRVLPPEGDSEYLYLTDPNPRKNVDGSLESDNDWVYTPIYIPSWAKEGLYEKFAFRDVYNPDDMDTCMQLQVNAINSVGSTGSGKSRAEEIEDLANEYYGIGEKKYDDGAAYSARYNIPVQLSGWIYNFTITGTTAYDVFANTTLADTSSGDWNGLAYSFAENFQDKRDGTKNRLGGSAVRFLATGQTTTNWKTVNTLTLMGAWSKNNILTLGKSNRWKYRGALPKGSYFAYTVKTIGNFWNTDGTDRLVMHPKFTWWGYVDGAWRTLTDSQLKLYYDSEENGAVQYYIPYGSERDKVINKASLSDGQFNQSYYDERDTAAKRYGDWITYSAYIYNKNKGTIGSMSFASFKDAVKNGSTSLGADVITPKQWAGREITSYSMTHITIPDTLRLFSGEPDQLRVNISASGRDGSDIRAYSDTISPFGQEYETEMTEGGDYSESGSGPEAVINGEKKSITETDKFRQSMQSWYGEYRIPSTLRIVNLKGHPEFTDFDSYPDSLNGAAVRAYYNAHGYVTGDLLGSSGDGRKYKDYMEYYQQKNYAGSKKSDESIFITKGYFEVSMDILAYMNGRPHLLYSGGGGGQNMWNVERYRTVPSDIDRPRAGITDEGMPTVQPGVSTAPYAYANVYIGDGSGRPGSVSGTAVGSGNGSIETVTEGNGGNPDNPVTVTDPDNPNNPDNPDNPNSPDNPDNPNNPDNPDNPGTPANPAQPDAPGPNPPIVSTDLTKSISDGLNARIFNIN